MKKGSKAELLMQKMLHADMEVSQKKYFCEILMYDMEQECIYLVLEDDLLSTVSLDAIFECKIKDAEEGQICCTGRVKERYIDENGQILKFKIENGFYKINIKSVDK